MTTTQTPRFQPPTDPLAAFFECPKGLRLAELCQSRMFERYKDNWRTPKALVSIALSSDNPTVFDNGTERASHDGLISNSFGFHPSFGTGHVLRTNGILAFFWNGEQVAIVQLANILMLPVLLDGERKESPRKRALTEAMNAD